jgi:hypothetical protein
MDRPLTLAETSRWMEEFYAGHSGFGISLSEMNSLWECGASPMYGEISNAGVDRLAGAISPPLAPEDVFYDLGSGIGRICVQLYLSTAVGKAVGIELSASRHEQACVVRDALQKLQPGWLPREDALEFRQDDFLSSSLADATVIYLCSLSYSDALMKRLAVRINEECPVLRLLVASTPFHELGWGQPGRRLILECSWSENVPFYFYTPPGRRRG